MKPILVVEDETVIRTALKRLLERNDYQVREAGSVTEAMNKHSLSDFSLIISDLRLPGAPGTDLIRPAGTTPVLIMTSYASLKSAVDSMKMGAVDYIAKPFDHDEMRAHLQAHDVTIEREAHHGGARGMGHSFYIRDPFGNMLEIKGPAEYPDGTA